LELKRYLTVQLRTCRLALWHFAIDVHLESVAPGNTSLAALIEFKSRMVKTDEIHLEHGALR